MSESVPEVPGLRAHCDGLGATQANAAGKRWPLDRSWPGAGPDPGRGDGENAVLDAVQNASDALSRLKWPRTVRMRLGRMSSGSTLEEVNENRQANRGAQGVAQEPAFPAAGKAWDRDAGAIRHRNGNLGL
jgi:hypothetical protein